MKKGDKVYCIKDIATNNNNNNNNNNINIITKGKLYTIQDIEKDAIIVITEKLAYRFILDNHTNINDKIFLNFNNYFLSNSEYRKLKLQKLSKHEI